MPVARRTRKLAAPPETVWDVVGDPVHQARWWPKVTRVEGVRDGTFTRVYATSKGKPIRADFHVTDVASGRSRTWTQQMEGTPFAKFMTVATETARIEAFDGGTVVTLEIRQKLRGLSRFGGFLVKRATKRQLDEALDALETLL
jgi:carbon monoxide dehydrogenase subunit G